jgi:adenylosuccinate synthase
LKEKLIFLDLEIKKKIYKLVAVEELVKEPYFEHFSLACVSWSIVVKEFNHILQDGPYICSSYYIQDIIANNITVWEAAQGTLLDEHYGFHPYTTWSTVTVHNALKYLKEVPYEKIGIMRAYTTRHGAGPFPTEDASLTDKYPELHNGTGKFQGNFRVGYLDIPLLRYAIDCNDGVDYIAITHFDYIENRKKIPLLSMRLDLKLHKLPPDNFLEREKQTQLLLQKPNKHSKKFNLCWTIAGDAEIFLGSVAFDLGIPIGIISRGPTHLDKTYL